MKYHSKPITVFPVDNDGIKWKAITFQNDHIHRERKKKRHNQSKLHKMRKYACKLQIFANFPHVMITFSMTSITDNLDKETVLPLAIA